MTGFNGINCPPTDLDPDKIRVGDRVSFRWNDQPRRFGTVRDIWRGSFGTRYGVQVDNQITVCDVWSGDITKEVG